MSSNQWTVKIYIKTPGKRRRQVDSFTSPSEAEARRRYTTRSRARAGDAPVGSEVSGTMKPPGALEIQLGKFTVRS